MDGSPTQGRKQLGLVLQEAGLITPAQLVVATKDQQHFDYLIGEIIALHGWVNKDTVEFFAEQWFNLLHRPNPLPIGHYLQMADLLNQCQIAEILTEQKKLGLRFGATAVFMGWLKQQTVDYFITNLKAEMLIQPCFRAQELTGGSMAPICPIQTPQRSKEDATPEEISQNGQIKIAIRPSILELPPDLAWSVPENFDIFADDDESFDLADVITLDDGNISS